MIKPEQLAKPGTEHSHQVALFCWANQQCNQWFHGTYAMPDSGKPARKDLAQQLSLMFAIPNGGLRHKAEANKLKSEGVKAGVPDIFLPVVGNKPTEPDKGIPLYHGLFIEMKKPSEKPKHSGAGGVSSNQSEWHINLRAQGYQVSVCYSWQEARDVVLAYLGVT
jgi:hypothetical protein